MRLSTRIGYAGLLGLIALGTGLAAAPAAHAEERISLFDVTATVTDTAVLEVTETIAYNFGSADRHGIFREIPLYDELPGGYIRAYDVTLESVTMDGRPVMFTQGDEGAYLMIKVGDPDRTITGKHLYQIGYRVEGALTPLTDADITDTTPPNVSVGDVELYWDWIGTAWEVPIQQATVTLTGTAPTLGTRCFTGAFGTSSQGCEVTNDRSTTTFTTADLEVGEGLTGVTAYPRSSFTTVPAPRIERSSAWVALVIGLISGAVGLLVILASILISLARRRVSKGVDIPLAPVRYSPPDDLRPAEIAAATDGEVDARALTATIVDLTARKYVTIGSADRSGFSLAWWGQGTDAAAWEQELLSAIFKGAPSAHLGEYDPTVTAATTSVSASLTAEALASGRRNLEGDKPDRPWRRLAFVGGIIAVVGTVLGFIVGMAVLAALLPLGLGGLIGGIIGAAITPRQQTKKSAMFLADVAGFRKLLDTDAGAARREFAHKLGLTDEAVFATMLPYAVLFGLDAAWTAAFPDLTEQQLHAMGFYVPAAYYLHDYSTFSTSALTSTMTPPSSSSGGSGFSGGSVGGGGGGGGGGSW